MKTNRYLLSIFCIFVSSYSLCAQTKNRAYIDYIRQYNDLAIKQMESYKIPASITLAQAILESGAGKSRAVQENNNHFGIKCGSDWKGDRSYHYDDGQNSCFRSYKNINASFEDHSRFLAERQRYAALFTLEITDYRGWAKGLQSSGYATDKAYANKLIKLIEDYELYTYDTQSKNNSKSHLSKKTQTNSPITITRDVYKTHGLIYVIAEVGDSFDKIADDMNFNRKKLIKYNEVPENFPLQPGDIVYLEKKKKRADKPYFDHVVQVGESMHGISQKYGLQLSRLYKLNKKKGDYTPEEGDVLKLR